MKGTLAPILVLLGMVLVFHPAGGNIWATIEDDIKLLEDEYNISFVYYVDDKGNTDSIIKYNQLDQVVQGIFSYPEPVLEFNAEICGLTINLYGDALADTMDEVCPEIAGCDLPSCYKDGEIHLAPGQGSSTAIHELAHHFGATLILSDIYTDSEENPYGGLKGKYFDTFSIDKKYQDIDSLNYNQDHGYDLPPGYVNWYSLINHKENFAVHVEWYATDPEWIMIQLIEQYNNGEELFYEKYEFIRKYIFFGKEFGEKPLAYNLDPPEYKMEVGIQQPIYITRGNSKLIPINAQIFYGGYGGDDASLTVSLDYDNTPEGLSVSLEPGWLKLSGVNNIATTYINVSADCDMEAGQYEFDLWGGTSYWVDQNSSNLCKIVIEVLEDEFSVSGPLPLGLLPGDKIITSLSISSSNGACSQIVELAINEDDIPDGMHVELEPLSVEFEGGYEKVGLSIWTDWDATPGEYKIPINAYPEYSSYGKTKFMLVITILPQFTMSIEPGEGPLSLKVVLENQAVNAPSYHVELSCASSLPTIFDPKEVVLGGGSNSMACSHLYYQLPLWLWSSTCPNQVSCPKTLIIKVKAKSPDFDWPEVTCSYAVKFDPCAPLIRKSYKARANEEEVPKPLCETKPKLHTDLNDLIKMEPPVKWNGQPFPPMPGPDPRSFKDGSRYMR
ncbi:MAG: hypothetical protein V1789_08845 [PVC group bacterium]